MNYEKILLSADSDADGMHIISLYIGFFQKYAPSIVEEGRLCKLNTPLICLKDNNSIKEMFFTFEAYNKYMEEHPNNKYRIFYYKGLGSWKATELRELIAKYGLDYFVEPLLPDSTTNKLVDEWLSTKQAEARREYLRNNKTFSIAKV